MSRLIRGAGRSFKHLGFHIAGRCNICGHPTVFLCTDPATARNNMVCPFCMSTSRNRHIMKVLLREVFPECTSIGSIPQWSAMRVLSAAVGDPLATRLSGHPAFVFSDLLPGVEPGGQIGPGIFCQDLERLTFPDESFDAVITEDVLEHVRHPVHAFREIYRVLRPGGAHIFTVPFLFDRSTLTRIDTSGEQDIALLPPEYHGDSHRGRIIAFRQFGSDLFGELAEIGFATSMERSMYTDIRAGVVNSHVFVSRRNGTGSERKEEA